MVLELGRRTRANAVHTSAVLLGHGMSVATADRMRVTISSTLHSEVEDVFERLLDLETLRFVAAPLLTFESVSDVPERWRIGRWTFRLHTLLGVPLGPHVIELVHVDHARGRLESRERGAAAKTWNHTVQLESVDAGTRMTDEVEISAGLLTPLVWAFANLFYRYRHLRWRVLLAGGTWLTTQQRWARGMASSGGLITMGFGLWHLGVPAWYGWEPWFADDPAELWKAVWATNLFMGLSLALLGLWSALLPVVAARRSDLLRGWWATLTALWTVRVVCQVLWPQGTEIPWMAEGMGVAFTLVLCLFAMPTLWPGGSEA